MSDIRQKYSKKTWTKDDYLISMDPSLVPLPKLNEAFATPDLHWAKPLPESIWIQTLNNSLWLGVYQLKPSDIPSGTTTSSNAQVVNTQALISKPQDLVAFARIVTDFTTFAYLTDVYTFPSHRGKGLASWMLSCLLEVLDDMPHLRRTLLFTTSWDKTVPFYEKLMGFSVLECRRPQADQDQEKGTMAIMSRLGNGHPSR